MPTTGSITKTIRINAEDLAILERIMRDKGVTWSGAVHHLIENVGVPQKPKKSVEGCTPNSNEGCTPSVPHEQLLKICNDLRMDYSDFSNEIVRLINEGCLMKEGNALVAYEQGLDVRIFLEVCNEVGANPQKIIDATTQGLRKGR